MKEARCRLGPEKATSEERTDTLEEAENTRGSMERAKKRLAAEVEDLTTLIETETKRRQKAVIEKKRAETQLKELKKKYGKPEARSKTAEDTAQAERAAKSERAKRQELEDRVIALENEKAKLYKEVSAHKDTIDKLYRGDKEDTKSTKYYTL